MLRNHLKQPDAQNLIGKHIGNERFRIRKIAKIIAAASKTYRAPDEFPILFAIYAREIYKKWSKKEPFKRALTEPHFECVIAAVFVRKKRPPGGL